MESKLTAREYRKEDWPMVEEWWSGHASGRALVESMLPPVGIVVERDGEPVAALWCYLSAGVGVAFLESPVARPGMSIKRTSEVMAFAMGAIEAVCERHDYGLLIVNTLPGIGRWLQRNCGFLPAGERVQLVKPILRHGT